MPGNYAKLSELEREFELDMGETSEPEAGANEELEDDRGSSFQASYELESDAAEFDSNDSEFETDADGEGELEGDYAERLYELSQTEFESPEEANEAVEGVLNEMYEQFLGLGNVKRYLKKKGRALLRKGIQLASKHPAFGLVKDVLSGQSLTKTLANVAKMAAASTPLGAAVTPLLGELGFPGDTPAREREAWNNFVDVAREAYLDLASNLNETADNPLKANQIATNALKRGLERTVSRKRARRQGSVRGADGSSASPRVIRIRLRPGERRIRLEIVAD